MDAISQVLREAARSAGALFLAPGSTYSLAALACSLAIALMLAIPRGRPVRPRVLWRALVGRRHHRSASGRADIGWFTAGLCFPGLLVGWALVSQARIAGAIAACCGTGAPLIALPAPAAAAVLTIAGFIAYELAYWVDHRLKHAVPALWHFHAVHHSAEHLSLLTNHRVHPVDTIIFLNIVALFTGVTGGALAILFGREATIWGVQGTNALGMLAAIAIGHLQHSHFWVHFGPRWGRRLLGAAHHQLHHSADPAHYGCNLGNSLALWDRMFGTFLMPPARRPPLRFGVPGLARPHGLKAAIVTPWVEAARSLAPGIRRPSPPAAMRSAP